MPPNQNPEQAARDRIDLMLAESGWIVQDKNKIDFNAGPGLAVREYPTDTGPADYALAERGKTTRNHVLELAVAKARERFVKKSVSAEISSEVVFNVQNPRTEPLLCVPDYLAWTVQRVFERGETRHYDFMRERITLVVDLYDAERYEGSRNYYTPQRPLTAENKLGPPVS